MRFLRYGLAFLMLCIPVSAYALLANFSITVAITALTPVFNCSGFATSGSGTTGNCGVRFPGSSFGTTMIVVGTFNGSNPAISGSQVNLIPANSNHNGNNLNYELAQVNVGQFSTTFTYVPNGMNLALVLQNNTNTAAAGTGYNFTAGAGCEASFFQGFTGGGGPPNNTFAVDLDQHDSSVAGGTTFTYSSVQYYGSTSPPNAPNPPGQSPCNPDLGGDGSWTYVGVNKVSTSPVAMNSPANNQGITTGHTYSVTISYDGSNLTISMFDVTAGGACPGAACFTNTWTGVNIPAIVGGTTAWVGLASGTGSGGTQIPTVPLLINTWSYSSN
jgi:hypothetical protein